MAVISLKAAKLDRIAARINAAHANAEAASATVVQCAVEAGQLLLEVKETMAHGAFGPWLDKNVFARQTARHYMRLAKEVDAMSESKRSHVSVLPLRVPCALSQAATTSTPVGQFPTRNGLRQHQLLPALAQYWAASI